MTEQDLDRVYAQLQQAVTEQIPGQSSLFLARFALLAMQQINDVDTISGLIQAASLRKEELQHQPV